MQIVVGQPPPKGKFRQTYSNNFIILLLPDSQTLLQGKPRVLDDDDGKSIHFERTTSNITEVNYSEYGSRVQKLKIESVAS